MLEHRIGYSNWPLQPIKAKNNQSKPLKHLDGLEIQSLSINIKMFITKNPSEKGNFCLAFMADEGRKGQNLVLAA